MVQAYGSGIIRLELVPHCASVPREGWVGSHDDRPLSQLGHRQAARLVTAIGTEIDAVYSSPALRCRQTVGPLAEAAGLEVRVLDALAEADGFGEPEGWVTGVYAPIAGPVAGAWSAGRMLAAIDAMVRGLPSGGRVVAASHGDVVPALLAALAGRYACALPDPVERGGWYSVEPSAGGMTISPRPAPSPALSPAPSSSPSPGPPSRPGRARG